MSANGNSDPAVELLREALAAREDQAPDPTDLATLARLRAGRARRHRWSGLAAAAALLLVAGVAAVVVVPRGGHGAVVTAGPTTATPHASHGSGVPASAPNPPRPGWKTVSSLGVELAVPKAWQVVGAIAGCGPLPAAVVERGGGLVAGCAYTEPRTLTVVRITGLSGLRQQEPTGSATSGPSVSPQPLNRLPASFTERTLTDGRTELVVSFVDRDTAVVVRGPDKDLVRRVFGTLQLADLDSAGCTAVLSDPPDWDRADRGTPTTVVVGDADVVSVCAYSSGSGEPAPRLAASVRLSGSDAAPVLDALRAAPAGRNPDADPATCSSSTPERSFLVLLVRHLDGALDQVRVHYDGCRNRYLADAGGQSRVSLALLQGAYSPLGMGFGVSSELG